MHSVREILRIVFTVVAVVIVLYLIYLLRKPISWLLISLFLALALSGPVNYLSRRMKRGLAITVVYLVLLAIPMLLIALIAPPLVTEANRFAENVPEYARRHHRVRATTTSACATSTRTTTSRASSRRRRASCPSGSAERPGRCATWASASSTPPSRW